MTIQKVLAPAFVDFKLRTPNIRLIGIIGHAGAGKDTVATYLQAHLDNAYVHSYAWFLKDVCSHAFGISRDYFDNQDAKKVQDEFWHLTPREVAQYVGTEMFRAFDPDFWIKRLIGHIDQRLCCPEGWEPYVSGDTIIIPDTRFDNECSFIKANNGHLIHIIRENCTGNVGIPGHASESGVESHWLEDSYSIVNNGTLEDLHAQVNKLIQTCFTF